MCDLQQMLTRAVRALSSRPACVAGAAPRCRLSGAVQQSAATAKVRTLATHHAAAAAPRLAAPTRSTPPPPAPGTVGGRLLPSSGVCGHDWIRHSVMESEQLRLERMTAAHIPALAAAAAVDPSIFRVTTLVTAPYLEGVLKECAAPNSTRVPFTVFDKRTGNVCGSTSYLNISAPGQRNVEVGYTWWTPAYQRSFVNTECKLIVFTEAFDTLQCVRVQLRTCGRNVQSQRAIERLGTFKEGVLRNERIMPDGFVRDTVVYSVIDREWPAMRARLHALIAEHDAKAEA